MIAELTNPGRVRLLRHWEPAPRDGVGILPQILVDDDGNAWSVDSGGWASDGMMRLRCHPMRDPLGPHRTFEMKVERS